MSDHKALALEIKEIKEIPVRRLYVPKRKTAKLITNQALSTCTTIHNFFENHLSLQNDLSDKKWAILKRDLSYKSELAKIFEDKNYDISAIGRNLNNRWKDIWEEIQNLRFTNDQKKAYNQIRKILKYASFEKREVPS